MRELFIWEYILYNIVIRTEKFLLFLFRTLDSEISILFLKVVSKFQLKEIDLIMLTIKPIYPLIIIYP